MFEKEVVPSSKAGINVVTSGDLALREFAGLQKMHSYKGASTGRQDLNENASGQFHRHDHSRRRTVADDVSESLSDIDDAEANGYLHNEGEMHYKRIIWELMNREHMKGRQQIRATEAKKVTSAKKPSKTPSQMENKKRLSSKINYDVLKKLTDEPEAVPKKAKREGMDSDSGKYGDLQSSEEFNIEGHEPEQRNYSYEFEQESEFSEEVDASIDYDANLYYGNEEDGYGYVEDYDNEEY